VGRTLAASLLPTVVIAGAWLSLEDPRRVRDAAVIGVLAIAPALVRAGWQRITAVAAAALGAAWLIFAAQPWELLPFRDERVVSPALEKVAQGVVDFYEVFLPLNPIENVEMHDLVLSAIFGFALAVALLVAVRRPISAAAVTVAGVGWPATLLGGRAVAFGTVALAAGLAIPLILRATSIRTLFAGAAIGTVVVVSAATASSATTLGRDSVLDWQSWDIRGSASQVPSVSFAWSSNYDGIRFPADKTVVFTVKGPTQATYWRASTLNLFSEEHWFEHLLWLGRVEAGSRTVLAPAQLVPVRASKRENWAELTQGRGKTRSSWVEQEVTVDAFADDHVVAAGTPLALDARQLGTVFQLSGNVLRASGPFRQDVRYRVWSYVPDPTPAALARSRGRYPAAASRYLEVDGWEFPAFGASGRELRVREFFADPSYADFRRYRPMYVVARRVTHDARNPYETVLALESWFRQRGGFRYNESPPRIKRSPLVAFVTRTKVGYCQHFAGAMAAMLRMLGIPARVAVGFTSGTRSEDRWVVTDHDAHAWVEVWFSGHGWIPFDPTPGRGTFGGDYSFASDSTAAVAALRRGQLENTKSKRDPRAPDAGDLPGDIASGDQSAAPSLVAIGLVLAAVWILVVGLGKAVVRRARYLSRDPRRLATASRRELEGFLRDQGAVVPRNATLADLQEAVHDELGLDGRAFVIAAARARFGPPSTVFQGASAARKELRKLVNAARNELSLWARFRGFVSLRSVRPTS
jgi:transglutaminase-like putative cysteine protease